MFGRRSCTCNVVILQLVFDFCPLFSALTFFSVAKFVKVFPAIVLFALSVLLLFPPGSILVHGRCGRRARARSADRIWKTAGLNSTAQQKRPMPRQLQAQVGEIESSEAESASGFGTDSVQLRVLPN